jgi:hypothetical protein
MLTLFAYRFALGGLIPKVSYFTRMDSFITASTLLAFLALLVAILTGNLATGEHGEPAQRIDVVCRTLFPGSVAGVIAFSFWLRFQGGLDALALKGILLSPFNVAQLRTNQRRYADGSHHDRLRREWQERARLASAFWSET